MGESGMVVHALNCKQVLQLQAGVLASLTQLLVLVELALYR